MTHCLLEKSNPRNRLIPPFLKDPVVVKTKLFLKVLRKNDLSPYCPSNLSDLYPTLSCGCQAQSIPVSYITVHTFIQIALYFHDVQILHSMALECIYLLHMF